MTQVGAGIRSGARITDDAALIRLAGMLCMVQNDSRASKPRRRPEDRQEAREAGSPSRSRGP